MNKFHEVKLTELKGEIDNSTVIVGDVSTVLSVMDRMYTERSTRQFEQHYKPTRSNSHNCHTLPNNRKGEYTFFSNT